VAMHIGKLVLTAYLFRMLGNLDKKLIPILVREIDAPINIIAGATAPPIPELQDVGVARVSLVQAKESRA